MSVSNVPYQQTPHPTKRLCLLHQDVNWVVMHHPETWHIIMTAFIPVTNEFHKKM